MAREERTSLHWGGEGSPWRGSQEPTPSSPHAGCPGAHSGAPWPLCPVSPSRYRGEWTQPKARPSTFPGRCPGRRPPLLRDACRPSRLGPDRGFLLRVPRPAGGSATCPLPVPPVLCQPNPRGRQCPDCPWNNVWLYEDQLRPNVLLPQGSRGGCHVSLSPAFPAPAPPPALRGNLGGSHFSACQLKGRES